MGVLLEVLSMRFHAIHARAKSAFLKVVQEQNEEISLHNWAKTALQKTDMGCIMVTGVLWVTLPDEQTRQQSI